MSGRRGPAIGAAALACALAVLPVGLARAAPPDAGAVTVEPGIFTIGGEHFPPDEIVDARALPDIAGGAAIMVSFTDPGAAHFARVAGSGAGKPMPIMLDGVTLAAPTLARPIEPVLMIGGNFDLPKAEALAKRLAGKDPVPDEFTD